MPDGQNHDIINIAVLIVVLGASFYLLLWNEKIVYSRYLDLHTILIFSLSYLFATFFLSPDLDIDSKPYKRWGILRFLWWPYKVIFKHRGFSHNPIIGPFSIVMNLGVIVIPMLLLAGVQLQNIPVNYVAVTILGMVVSMEVHIISDCLISKYNDFF